MAEKDPRLKQLEADIENERKTTGSRYAFVGFGRSTDLGTAKGKVEEAGIKLIGGLTSLITAENRLNQVLKQIQEARERGEDVSGADTTNERAAVELAKKRFASLQDQQRGRLQKLSEDILTASSRNSLQSRYRNAFSRFRSRPSGRNYLKIRPVKSARIKTFKPGEGLNLKENLVKNRKIGGIIASKNRLSARVLEGLKP